MGYGATLKSLFDANPALVKKTRNGSRALTLRDGLCLITIQLKDLTPLRQNRLPTCGARSKSTGAPCRNPVVPGCTRCRVHGCGGRTANYRGGAKTEEGRRRCVEAVRRRWERQRALAVAA